MRAAERGHLKTLIITTKVLPSAEGKVLTVDPSFQSLVINGVHEEDEIRVLRPATFRVLAAKDQKTATVMDMGTVLGTVLVMELVGVMGMAKVQGQVMV